MSIVSIVSFTETRRVRDSIQKSHIAFNCNIYLVFLQSITVPWLFFIYPDCNKCEDYSLVTLWSFSQDLHSANISFFYLMEVI